VKRRFFFLVFDVSSLIASKKGVHGTFKDVEENVIPRIKSLGFDVLYIPPIHPIGHQFRKGKTTRPPVNLASLEFPMVLVLSWAAIQQFFQN
jgi:hypothetical protein